jgi:hypothetical protein
MKKQHQIYKTKEGIVVPSVTTIINQLAKPALIHWAWQLGMKGVDYKAQRDEMASVGSLVHEMILADLKGEKYSTDEYTKAQIDLAENSFLSYLEWKKKYQIEPVFIETPFVSEINLFGGTPDFVGNINKNLTIIDFKSGEGLYEEYWYQLAGYGLLLEEAGYEVEKFMLVRIGRTEDEAFQEEIKSDLFWQRQIFFDLLDIYQIKERIKGNE